MRQATLEHARDSDAWPPVQIFTLQSGTGDRRGFFVALPVYAPGVPHETVRERKHNLRGYVQAVFQTSVLIETILEHDEESGARSLFLPGGYDPDLGADLFSWVAPSRRRRPNRCRAPPLRPVRTGPARSKSATPAGR